MLTHFLQRNILFSLIILFLPIITYAQSGSVKAIVVDGASGQGISSVSVALIQQNSQAYVQGTQSNDQGQISFSALKAGTYAMRLSYVGYETLLKEQIIVNENAAVDLGKISLQVSGEYLDEVVVEGRTPAMQIGVDRKVFNVAQSMVSVGGTASDLLANVPTLQVDMDGTVQLRGSSSVKILIDGKESAMAGSNISQLLQSMPANSIERVEIITNPSSKYDAEGQSGIVNIVLKKDIKTGFNGAVNLSAGNNNNYSAGISLNYRDRKVNYFGNYNFNRRNMLGSGVRNNTYTNNSEVNNTSESSRLGLNHSMKVGVDYYLDQKTTLGFSSNLSVRDNQRDQDLFYTYVNHPRYTGNSTRLSRQHEDDLGFDLNFDFKRELKRKGEEIVANISYGNDREDGTSDFDLTSSVHALYANYQNKLTDKISYQVGLRAEQAYLNSTYYSKDPANPGSTKGKLDYFRLYPTVFLTHAIGEDGDKIQASYSRRVNRPQGWQINPFMNVSDEMNYRQGNPNLLPEDIHSFELNYAKILDKWNLISTVYYRKTNDMIQPFIYEVNQETSVTYSRWENLTNASSFGLELIAKVDLSKKFDLMANFNLMHNKINGNENFQTTDQSGMTWNSNLTANYRVTPTFSAQVRGDYFAPRVMAQGKTIHMSGIDVALKKDVLNRKGSIMFNVRDLLDKRKFGANTNAGNVLSYFEHRWMKRMFTLSFSYRFGSQDLSKSKPRESQGQDMGGEGF